MLVVDGSLNAKGESIIQLTRSQNLSETLPTPHELRAKVAFEDETGNTYPLTERGKGSYSLPARSFDQTKQYRITIRTADSKEYASEFVPLVKVPPPIDEITWAVTSKKGVQLYVSTHDVNNSTRYYRWSFEETWKYVSAFNSRYDWKNGYPVLRINDIYNCYRTAQSTKIAVGSTANLSQDIVSNFPLLYIEQRSEKIRFKYSILVKQLGLTKEAYDYWFQLQRMTENLGTLFDPQPSQLVGNIKCTSDLSEPVIGYFIAGSTTEKRIFISSDYLPRASKYITSFDGCVTLDTLSARSLPLLNTNIVLIESAPSGPGMPSAYTFTGPGCGDCRSAGGTTTQPPFWQ